MLICISSKHLLSIAFFGLLSLTLHAQNKGKLALEVNYGLQGDFFVRSYDETHIPGGGKAFYNKNFIGTIGGVELKYKLGRTSTIGIAFSESVNSKPINFKASNGNTSLYLEDFNIRHTNSLYQLYYQKDFKGLFADVGLLYLRSRQQEITLYANSIELEERNYKNSKLEEGGVFVGLGYTKRIDTKFNLGIKSRLYYLASTNALETITLTPSLTYNF
jgi:hypothetical protein